MRKVMSPFSQLISLIIAILIVNYVSGQASFTCPDGYSRNYPDISNCHRYWQCSFRTASLNWCSLGSRFDNNMRQCVDAARADCGVCHSFGIDVAKIDCQNYRLCVIGKAYNQTCPEGTYFDESLGECNVIQSANVCPISPCQGVGPGIVFQRNNTDCRTYHICVYERLGSTRVCPPGTWFKDVTCTTELPEECIYNPIADDEIIILKATVAPAVLKLKTAPAQGCPSEGTTLVMSDGDCTKYSICSGGRVLEERDCPKGLYFSEELGVCASSTDVYCPF